MAGYEVVSVSGFEEFSRAVEQHHGKTIFAYFTGSKDAGGKSWCPDCVQGERPGLGARGVRAEREPDEGARRPSPPLDPDTARIQSPNSRPVPGALRVSGTGEPVVRRQRGRPAAF